MDASDSVPVTVRQYGYLMVEDENGEMVKNPDTVKISTAYAESSLKNVSPGERFQFFRHGYFVADSKLHTKEAPVFNEIVGLKSSWKK